MSIHAPAADVLAVARQVAAIVRRATGDPAFRVFLFGSHVTGRASPRSDLDVGIDGPTPVDARTMQRIRDECEHLPTLRTIDLVDLATVGPGFRRRAVLWPIEPEGAR